MLGLANKQQQPLHSVAVPLQAANKFYQSLFSNSPLAIPLQQFSFNNTSFRNPPFSNPPSSNFFLAKKLSIKKLPTSKNLMSSFRESFISSDKQGDGAMVLGEGCDIVTGETCIK
jgi:hypothetical protein